MSDVKSPLPYFQRSWMGNITFDRVLNLDHEGRRSYNGSGQDGARENEAVRTPMVEASVNQKLPFCCIAVPVLNEERFIEGCLTSLLANVPPEALEVLVLDGGSTDRTAEVVAAIAEGDRRVRLVQNPGRIQAAAINLAARIADPRATALIRADAHCIYPADFVGICLQALGQTRATSVVVPMTAAGRTGRQRAIAAAQNSRMGNGGSAHRMMPVSRFVDHAHHAAFDRAFFLSIGGYDENFAQNEDAEYDRRAARAGGRAWGCSDAAVTYFPRETLTALARQYYRYGTGRARTIRKHRYWPRARQMAPLAILAGVLGGLAFMPVDARFGLVPLTYVAVCLLWAANTAWRARDGSLLIAGVALVVMHMSWAIGLLSGMLRRAGPGEATMSSPVEHLLRTERP